MVWRCGMNFTTRPAQGAFVDELALLQPDAWLRALGQGSNPVRLGTAAVRSEGPDR